MANKVPVVKDRGRGAGARAKANAGGAAAKAKAKGMTGGGGGGAGVGGVPPVLAGERPKVPPPGQSGDPGFQPFFQVMGHVALALYQVLRITYNQRGEKGYTNWLPHATWGPWNDHIGGGSSRLVAELMPSASNGRKTTSHDTILCLRDVVTGARATTS